MKNAGTSYLLQKQELGSCIPSNGSRPVLIQGPTPRAREAVCERKVKEQVRIQAGLLSGAAVHPMVRVKEVPSDGFS